ncbi:hypothetical protein V475_22215 [Sphingobium baderi LL03]|uniref:Polysaccharide biosynthesis protein C-terminal domain-containing protein n=2 Tax=Sphingobium baderi TaxID=1332080 RepID=T0GLQ9_9SPHN|nr:hypothetical protein L485_03900 [Sphingobium baderi LL03]KMS52222.1 hypothetical protein V475_22215 [Sphingobium baderi LL03]
MLFFGLDLYTYTSREIVKVNADRRGALLKGQVALVGILYLVLAPVVLIVLWCTELPVSLVMWFLPVLILEHLNQELYRLFIILSRQVMASVLLFLRQGAWAVAAAGLMVFSPGGRNLDFILLLWTGAGIGSAAVGLWQVHQLRLGGWREPVDWLWIRRGIMVSSTFLTATLAVRAIQTIDRYWLEYLAGIEVVGAYVLFFGVASALSVFLDAGIFSFYYPKLIQQANQARPSDLHNTVRKTALMTLGVCLGYAVVSSLLLPVLLNWIGRDVYYAQFGLYYWILAAMIAYSLGMVPHYALYAQGKDRPIIASHLASLVVFAGTTLTAMMFSNAYAVPVGVFTAMTIVLLWKTAAYVEICRHDTREGVVPHLESHLT